MTKKEILKKCDSYIELFKDSINANGNNVLEFMDFAELHLPKSSNLAFEINRISKSEFSEHAERIKDFIKTNGSKAIVENKNLLSDKSNAELIGIISGVCVLIFTIGFYFGTEKININFIKTENKLLKLKDSLSSIKTFNSSNGMPNGKEKNTETKNTNN
tara:strand:- start:38 stop:517 length:480 start_codon:yes stop_codon:yes gene_type:complete